MTQASNGATEQPDENDPLDDLRDQITRANTKATRAEEVQKYTQRALADRLDGLTASLFEEKVKAAIAHWRTMRTRRQLGIFVKVALVVVGLFSFTRLGFRISSLGLELPEKLLVMTLLAGLVVFMLEQLVVDLGLDKSESRRKIIGRVRDGRSFARDFDLLKSDFFGSPEHRSESLQAQFHDYLSRESNWLDPDFLEQVFFLKSRDWTEAERLRIRLYIAQLPTHEVERDPRRLV